VVQEREGIDASEPLVTYYPNGYYEHGSGMTRQILRDMPLRGPRPGQRGGAGPQQRRARGGVELRPAGGADANRRGGGKLGAVTHVRLVTPNDQVQPLSWRRSL